MNAQAYNSVLANLVKGDYGGKADSLANVLIEEFMNKQKGTFWSTPKDVERSSTYIYWQQAHAMDVLVYAYERHKGDDTGLASKYYLYMRRWYSNHANNYSGGTTGFENPYTDDMCWICLTLMHMSEATGLDTYANTAKTVFDKTIMRRSVEDEKGLWLPWNDSPGAGPNACTVGPACLLSAKLHLKYGDEKYLTYAEKFYTFMQNNICKSDGRVEEPPLTYTQGTFGEACRVLYHITGKTIYRNKAALYINYAFTDGRCTSNGLLRDEGSSMDQSLFKAVLMPYAVNFCLDESMSLTYRRNLVTLVQKNANALWKNLDKDSYPVMYCPYYWGKPFDPSKTASMGAMASGASLMENTARMCIALTTRDDGESIDIPLQNEPILRSGIYSLDGKRLRENALDREGLPKGIYIINTKKVILR
jgi:predicted alpha-1,6-mannanase (GH76 family)